MRTLRAVAASGGVAVGPAQVLTEPARPTGGRVRAGDEPAEIERFAAAAAAVAQGYEDLASGLRADGRPDEAEILSAQGVMALDPALADDVAARVRGGDDAVAATLAATDGLAGALAALEDDLLAARAVDLRDVGERIARRLAGLSADAGPSLAAPSVVVANDLAPSVTATLPRERLLGIALEAGSATAHAAILARAYGIPAVVGARGLLDAVATATAAAGRPPEIAIDGGTGEIVVDPDDAGRERFRRRTAEAREAARRDLDEATLPAVTRDGVDVVLLANVGTPAEAEPARRLGARGVGLFRTEFLFLERSSAPDEDEQAAAYRAVVETFAPEPVTIRLLDVGGDKPIPYIAVGPEANPFLGVRALRLAATAPAIFETQLRAAMRAAVAGPVKVMAPMVADPSDARTLLVLADAARRDLEARAVAHDGVALGAMIEIPAAALVADRLLEGLDFASLGTNDLLQYALAADRGNPWLARYHDPLHPAHLRLVAASAAAAARTGRELSVCGEMAGDPLAALVLVGLGIRTLSMSASRLGPVRRAIRAAEGRHLETVAREVLDLGTAEDVRVLLGASGVG